MAITSVSSSTSAAQLVAEDGNRAGLMVTNTDANALYVLLDSGTASATNHSISLATNETFSVSGYTGEVRGVWAADGAGVALVTTWGR